MKLNHTQEKKMKAENTDLPGTLELAIAIGRGEWPHTTDAAIWAEKWLETLKEHPNIVNDIDTMRGWFANAIMAGCDAARMDLWREQE